MLAINAWIADSVLMFDNIIFLAFTRISQYSLVETALQQRTHRGLEQEMQSSVVLLVSQN